MSTKNKALYQAARNARRRADTWIKNLNKIAYDTRSGKHTAEERKEARSEIKKLKEQRQATYFGRGKNKKSAQEVMQGIAATNALANSAKIIKTANGAANLVTQHQINLATKKNGNSIYTKEEVKAFYRATQKIWFGADLSINRNKLIMEAIGTTSLSEAFEFITSLPSVRKAIQGYEGETKQLKEDELTKEQLEFYSQMMTEDDADADVGSPTYLEEVPMIGNDSDSIANLRYAFQIWKKQQKGE